MQTQNQNLTYFEVNSRPFGYSFGNWTVRWWRWALGIPKSKNPLNDETGINATINQRRDVWFLAGKLADRESSFPLRRCNLPAGTSILFPIINCEANMLEFSDKNSEDDLIDYVVSHTENMTDKKCLVDGIMIPGLRVPSNPRIFDIYIHQENILGIPSGKTIASADGYWVFLKPLEIGEHVIEFHGSCSSGINKSGSKYILHVS